MLPFLERTLVMRNETATFKVEVGDVLEALLLTIPDLQHVEHSFAVWDYPLTMNELLDHIALAESLLPRIEVLLERPLEFKGRIETKIQVKSKGLVWRVHKYDPDPFPSNPHAHNFEQNLKLHLGTGEFYRARKSMGHMKRKDLLELRSKIAEYPIGLPPLSV